MKAPAQPRNESYMRGWFLVGEARGNPRLAREMAREFLRSTEDGKHERPNRHSPRK